MRKPLILTRWGVLAFVLLGLVFLAGCAGQRDGTDIVAACDSRLAAAKEIAFSNGRDRLIEKYRAAYAFCLNSRVMARNAYQQQRRERRSRIAAGVANALADRPESSREPVYYPQNSLGQPQSCWTNRVGSSLYTRCY